MRTTIDIDDQLLLYAKLQAVKQGCTIKQILEEVVCGKVGIKAMLLNLKLIF